MSGSFLQTITAQLQTVKLKYEKWNSEDMRKYVAYWKKFDISHICSQL